MTDDFAVELDAGLRLEDALIVTAFPTVGNVACTAARFLVKHLKLPYVGGVYSPRLPPVASLLKGRPGPPVEAYAALHACGPGGVCKSLVVLTSDVPIDDGAAHDLALRILDWSREVRAGGIAALDGVKSARPDAKVLGAGATPAALDRLRSFGVPAFEDGILRGVSAVLLHRGAAQKVDVYGLLVRAASGSADTRGALALIREADRVLIGADFPEHLLRDDVEPMQEEAGERQRAASRTVDVAYL